MNTCISFSVSSVMMYLTVPMPSGCRLPTIPLIEDILTGLGGVIKSSSLGVIDIEAPESKIRITPVFI